MVDLGSLQDQAAACGVSLFLEDDLTFTIEFEHCSIKGLADVYEVKEHLDALETLVTPPPGISFS